MLSPHTCHSRSRLSLRKAEPKAWLSTSMSHPRGPNLPNPPSWLPQLGEARFCTQGMCTFLLVSKGGRNLQCCSALSCSLPYENPVRRAISSKPHVRELSLWFHPSRLPRVLHHSCFLSLKMNKIHRFLFLLLPAIYNSLYLK